MEHLTGAVSISQVNAYNVCLYIDLESSSLKGQYPL